MSDFFDYRQPDGRNPETIRIFFIKCSHPIDFGKYSCYIINRTDDEMCPGLLRGIFKVIEIRIDGREGEQYGGKKRLLRRTWY